MRESDVKTAAIAFHSSVTQGRSPPSVPAADAILTGWRPNRPIM
ncbi:hypothetical protein [Phormidium yuhuli]|nr:hypothetical protein [Phormidium yuhuli]